jgi:hypothetical protein
VKTKSMMHVPMVCVVAFLCAGTAEAATISLQQGGSLTLDASFSGLVQLDGVGAAQITASPIFSPFAISSGTPEVWMHLRGFHY